jgi:putative transposase
MRGTVAVRRTRPGPSGKGATVADFPARFAAAAGSPASFFTFSAKNNLQKQCFLIFWNRSGTQSTASRMDTAAEGILNRDEMESRRLLAAQDLQRGLSQSQVARKFGVSRTTASRWYRSLSGKGLESLRKRRAPGRPSRLNAEQLREVAEVYRSGPRAAGFESDRWTTARFADPIFGRYGVRYDPDHVGRIMHRLGLRARTRQRPRVPDLMYTRFRSEISGAA